MAQGKHYRSNKTPARQTHRSMEDSLYNYRPSAQPPVEKPAPAAPTAVPAPRTPVQPAPVPPTVPSPAAAPAPQAPVAAPQTPAVAPRTSAPAPYTPSAAPRTSAQPPRTGRTAAPARKKKKNIWIPIVAVLLLLAAAGIVGYILWDLGLFGMLLKLLR